MRLIPSDPDIQTVFSRIKDKSLDLQPDFQRGEVWSQPKQKLLIDSVLRNWYVPPIHVVRVDNDEQVVLDGQQRLRAIELFMRGRFAVEGRAEPADESILEFHGLRYDQLPDQARRRFDRFTLRLFELVDYAPEEPSELFFRLNQPATLTEAEKRNAFFGAPRQQVRGLTEMAQRHGMQPDRIGFSSARLAYEDVVARFVWTVEVSNLAEKVTASRVTARYRSPEAVSDEVIQIAERSLASVFGAPCLDDSAIRLNKATAHSWLLYAARTFASDNKASDFNSYLEWFERTRGQQRELARRDPEDRSALAVSVFNDRATARVNDVSSVLLRDAVLWALAAKQGDATATGPRSLLAAFAEADGPATAESRVLETITRLRWAQLR
jgi:hypothetical protein